MTNCSSIEQPRSEAVAVPLNNGRFALIDAQDAERVLRYNWLAKVDSDGCLFAYAHAKRTGGYETLRMHRFIAGVADPSILVTHKNGDGLDNRRSSNLRIGSEGKVFGRLTVKRELPPTAEGVIGLECVCVCGNTCLITKRTFQSQKTRSCGCLRRETAIQNASGWRAKIEHSKIHLEPSIAGRRRECTEHVIWRTMIARCHNPNSGGFKRYGAKGISVCDRWRNSYADFFADVGSRPTEGHSLDRFPDKNGNYEPGNVRWATNQEQARNTNTNRVITYQGESRCLVEWAEITGLRSGIIAGRLQSGWSEKDALSTPNLGKIRFHGQFLKTHQANSRQKEKDRREVGK